jgi:hypothetical protein
LTYLNPSQLGGTTAFLPTATSGNAGYLGMFKNTVDLGNSVMFQSPEQRIGVGTTSPAAPFNVASTAAPAAFFDVISPTLGALPAVFRAARGTPGAPNTTGAGNVAVGAGALNKNCHASPACPASYNTAVGTSAGDGLLSPLGGNITGSYNTFIGARAGFDAPPNLTNATAIGANARVTASNALVLGGLGANVVNVGIGVSAPDARLQVFGDVRVGTSGTNGCVQGTPWTGIAPRALSNASASP